MATFGRDDTTLRAHDDGPCRVELLKQSPRALAFAVPDGANAYGSVHCMLTQEGF